MALMEIQTWKGTKRFKALQHYEIKMPIYIDNLIFFSFFFCFHLVATLKDHKYSIVDWIRLEALAWRKARAQLVKIVFFSQPIPRHQRQQSRFSIEKMSIWANNKKAKLLSLFTTRRRRRAAGAMKNDHWKLYDIFLFALPSPFLLKQLSESSRHSTLVSASAISTWFISCDRRADFWNRCCCFVALQKSIIEHIFEAFYKEIMTSILNDAWKPILKRLIRWNDKLVAVSIGKEVGPISVLFLEREKSLATSSKLNFQ